VSRSSVTEDTVELFVTLKTRAGTKLASIIPNS
jgi:hypothetical protein